MMKAVASFTRMLQRYTAYICVVYQHTQTCFSFQLAAGFCTRCHMNFLLIRTTKINTFKIILSKCFKRMDYILLLVVTKQMVSTNQTVSAMPLFSNCAGNM